VTALYLAHKIAHDCTDCGKPAAPDRQLCESCGTMKNAAQRRAMSELRAWRRLFQLCAECGVASSTYRCQACRPCAQISTPVTAA
jgi:hypothetical protein